MKTRSHSTGEIRVTVDGAEFYALVRAMKRGFRASDLGDVTISAQNGILTVVTKRGGGTFPCTASLPVTAHLLAGRFLKLVSLATDAKRSGPVTIVFRPGLGEIALPSAGVKARFLEGDKK